MPVLEDFFVGSGSLFGVTQFTYPNLIQVLDVYNSQSTGYFQKMPRALVGAQP